MKILLIINKEKKFSDQIINITKKKFKNSKILDHNDPLDETKDYDYILSYLSKKILKKKILKSTKQYNINFHPGSSKYPGIGCFNFALYNNEKSYGVTAHLMGEKVDTGKIIVERKFKIKKNLDVKMISEKSYMEMFKLYKEILYMIKKDKVKFSAIKWKRKPYQRSDLDKLSKINFDDSKSTILKKIRCTYFEEKPKPYILIKGIKFNFEKKI
ncbi:formyltransferase family protein [Candidatus Pelagibacter sp.]|nr:formyltransferase family protein [Candidatus Pelagibacter sp.]